MGVLSRSPTMSRFKSNMFALRLKPPILYFAQCYALRALRRGALPTSAKDRRGSAVQTRQSPVCGLSRSQHPCLHQRPTPLIPSFVCPSGDGGLRRGRRFRGAFFLVVGQPGMCTDNVPSQRRHFIESTHFDVYHTTRVVASSPDFGTSAATLQPDLRIRRSHTSFSFEIPLDTSVGTEIVVYGAVITRFSYHDMAMLPCVVIVYAAISAYHNH